MISRKNISSFLVFILVVMNEMAFGQPAADSMRNSLSTEKIMLLKSSWAESQNAAGIRDFEMNQQIGRVWLMYDHSNGDYHRFQEEQEQKRFGYFAKGYSKLNNWRFYGAFNYYTQKDKGVKWTDVLDPYNDNPYIVGDAVGGTYNKEFFDMQGKGAWKMSEHFDLGFDVHYRTGVGARRKDPRPENKATCFDFKPGVLFNSGNWKLGLNLNFETAKEDISLETVTDSIYNFYHFKGLGVYSLSTELDSRSHETQVLGGAFQVEWKGSSWSNLTEASFHQQETEIKRGTSMPLQVVLLEQFRTDLSSTFLFQKNENRLQKLKLSYTDKHIYGHEPVVEPRAEQENYQWSTVAKYLLYWHRENTVGLNYSWYRFVDRDHIDWGITAGGNVTTSDISYYFVPERNRQQLNYFRLDGKFEKEIRMKALNLVLSANGAWQEGFDSSLELVQEPVLLATTQVDLVQHDYGYLNSGLTEWGCRLDLARDITLYKQGMQAFVSAIFLQQLSRMEGSPQKNTVNIQLGINF